MKLDWGRRQFMTAGSALALASPFPVLARDKPLLRFSAVFSNRDIRADMMRQLAEALRDDFSYQGEYGDSLFRQGTELLAIQRGLLEMGNVAPQDIADQIPAWSVVTAGYLFRNAAHVKAFFASDASVELKRLAGDRLGLHILGPTYYGLRQIGLKGGKEIKTPADLAGIKLRMPGGTAWQFLGAALGATPTPMAFIDVYNGLKGGLIDAQDNPLPNVENMRFYEVIDQIVLTSHLVGFDLLIISKKLWDTMSPDKRARFQTAVDKALDFSTAKHLSRESELVAHFKSKGLKVYEPDIAAFRKHVQARYLASSLARDWPPGLVDKINAM